MGPWTHGSFNLLSHLFSLPLVFHSLPFAFPFFFLFFFFCTSKLADQHSSRSTVFVSILAAWEGERGPLPLPCPLCTTIPMCYLPLVVRTCTYKSSDYRIRDALRERNKERQKATGRQGEGRGGECMLCCAAPRWHSDSRHGVGSISMFLVSFLLRFSLSLVFFLFPFVSPPASARVRTICIITQRLMIL